MSTKEPDHESEPHRDDPALPAVDPTSVDRAGGRPGRGRREPPGKERREPPGPGEVPLDDIPPPAGTPTIVSDPDVHDGDEHFSDIGEAIKALLGDDAADVFSDPGSAPDGDPDPDRAETWADVRARFATESAAPPDAVVGPPEVAPDAGAETGEQIGDGAGGADVALTSIGGATGAPPEAVDSPGAEDTGAVAGPGPGGPAGPGPDVPAGSEPEANEPVDAGPEAFEPELGDPSGGVPEVSDPDVFGPVADAPGRRRRRSGRLTVLAVVVALLAGALAVTKTQQVSDLTTQRDDRRAIERVAAEFGVAYLSYDFEHAEESGRAVQALATMDFARSYAATSAPGIQELFSSRQTTTEARTKEVFVGSVHPRRARALVVVDVTASSPGDGEQRLDDVSFVLDLTRTTGGWRVARVARAPQPVLDGGAASAPGP